MIFPQEKSQEIKQKMPKYNQNPLEKKLIKTQSFGLGLKAKATMLAFVFGVVPVSIVSWVSYYYADIAITEKTSLAKVNEVEKISDSLSKFLQEIINNNKNIVNFLTLVYPNIQDIQLLNTEEKTRLENILAQVYGDYLMFQHIGIYNLQGDLIVQSLGIGEESNKEKYQFFQDVVKTGNIVISEPLGYEKNDPKNLAIYLAIPLKNNQNKTQAIVISRIGVTSLGNAILRNTNLATGTSYQLIDSNGKIFQNFQDSQKTPIGTKISEILPVYDQINTLRHSKAWINDNSNKQTLNAYTPIVSQVKLNWSLVTSTSPDLAFAAQKQLAQTITIGTVIMAVLAVIVGSIIANLSIRPVLVATAAVEKLGQGQLTLRLPVQGNDEWAILNDNINKMAREIDDLLATLQRNSDQLTNQNNILSELAKNEAIIQGDLPSVALNFTETVAHTLNVERVAIWLYNLPENTLVTTDIYDLIHQQHLPNLSLSFADYPDYINALNEAKNIVAFDVHTNPITAELITNDLANIGIKSKLDIPISLSGKTVGVISCEQISKPRTWRPQEQTFITSVANLIALTLENQTLQNEVGSLLDLVSDVETGNLTVKAEVSDRTTGLIADTLNRLIEELGQILQQVLDTAKQVSEGTDNLQIISQTVAEGTIRQAEAVTQVLDLSQLVEQSAEKASEKVQTTKKSLSSLDVTVKIGEKAIATLSENIQILQQGTDQIIQQMKTLGEFVGLADQFLQDQGDIAQQTQVLALNAALVAARAGEQKDPRRFENVAKDFEGIANQISILAQKTNEGLTVLEERTSQIHTVVATVDHEVQNLGGLVGEFTKGVNKSSRLFKGVRNVTINAMAAGEKVAQSNEEILTATSQTVEAIKNIEITTIETAKITKDSLKQAKVMGKLSHKMLERIKFFKLP
jgi:methyl-accepting chemotaxis protein PixJ